MLLKENTQDVVSDVIDGEVVLLHLKAGIYYSLIGSGGSLWGALREGASPEQLLAALQRAYPDQPGLDTDLQAWLQRLREEMLVSPVDGVERTLSVSFEQPYEPPQLNKCTDLQDLLLVDPIHEVDATGWPALPA